MRTCQTCGDFIFRDGTSTIGLFGPAPQHKCPPLWDIILLEDYEEGDTESVNWCEARGVDAESALEKLISTDYEFGDGDSDNYAVRCRETGAVVKLHISAHVELRYSVDECKS